MPGEKLPPEEGTEPQVPETEKELSGQQIYIDPNVPLRSNEHLRSNEYFNPDTHVVVSRDWLDEIEMTFALCVVGLRGAKRHREHTLRWTKNAAHLIPEPSEHQGDAERRLLEFRASITEVDIKRTQRMIGL